MPHYLITYDLRKRRDYKPLYDCFAGWEAVHLLESVWLADLKGPAPAIRDILSKLIDADDGIAIVELMPNFDWATLRVKPAGSAWLRARSP